MFTPDCLRLLVIPLQKAPPVACCDNPKKYSSRWLSALGRYPAKSHSSLWKCTPKRRSGQTTSGCLSTPTARLPKWPVAITRKSTAPDSLRLWVNPFRKISPAARCDDPKKSSSRLPSAFGQSSAKSHSSLRNCALKRRSGQAVFGFWSILFEKSIQRPAAMTRKSVAPDSFQLLVDTSQKVPPAFGNIPRKNVYARPLPAAFSHRPRGSPSDPLR